MKRFLSVVAALSILVGSARTAYSENLTLPEHSKWLVLASRETVAEAKSVAGFFLNDPNGVRVVLSNNGRYAVLLGPVRARKLAELQLSSMIPEDAYLAVGTKFRETVWLPGSPVSGMPTGAIEPISADSSEIKCSGVEDAAARLECYDNGAVASAPQQVASSSPPLKAAALLKYEEEKIDDLTVEMREKLCKASISLLMSRDPAGMKTVPMYNDQIVLSYTRDDSTFWEYGCRFEGQTVFWKASQGRWRVELADERFNYRIVGPLLHLDLVTGLRQDVKATQTFELGSL